MDDADHIPAIAVHRGVEIHDQQSPQRIKTVRKEIDRVLRMSDLMSLVIYVGNASCPPESRSLAAAKIEQVYAKRKLAGRQKIEFDIARVRAYAAAVASKRWRSSTHYGSLLDRPPEGQPQPAKRESRLLEED